MASAEVSKEGRGRSDRLGGAIRRVVDDGVLARKVRNFAKTSRRRNLWIRCRQLAATPTIPSHLGSPSMSSL
jgi:hypothetical protein